MWSMRIVLTEHQYLMPFQTTVQMTLAIGQVPVRPPPPAPCMYTAANIYFVNSSMLPPGGGGIQLSELDYNFFSLRVPCCPKGGGASSQSSCFEVEKSRKY